MGEWKEYPFGQLLSGPVRNGIYKEKKYHGRGVKIVNMGELFAYPRLRDIEMKRVELSAREKEKSLLRTGDLIFARRSLTAEGAGKCSLVHEIKEETTFESSIIRARPNKDMASPEFLYYYFNSRYGKYLLGTILRQVAVAGITGSDLTELILNVPDLPEQKAIAEVLSSLDDKIDLLDRQNKTLETLAETLFRQLFIEEAHDSWLTGTLPDEFDFTMGQSPRGDTFNEEGKGTIFYQGRTDFGFRFPEPRVFTVSPTRFAKKFDTLVSVRAPVGDMNMAIEDCSLGRGVASFRYKRDPKYHSYTYYKMRNLMAPIKQFEDNGTVFGSIGKEDFKKLEIEIPNADLVDKFQAVAAPLDEKIFQNTKQITNLEKTRDSLLPKLMSGDVTAI